MVVYVCSLGCEDIEFSFEDVGCLDLEFLYWIFVEVIKVGVIIFNIFDMVGYILFSEFGGLIIKLKVNIFGVDKVIFFIYC